MKNFDVAVLGLGALGSAAVFQLARRGVRVVGFDRFAPPHPWGSSHGETRITRQAIGEGEHLTPIVQRSHALWREIEDATGSALFSQIGALIIAGPARTSFTHVTDFFDNTLAAARRHGIAHARLDSGEIRRLYPQFCVRDDESAYYEPGGGYLHAESCVRAQLELAQRHGAELHVNERAAGFSTRAHDVMVETDNDRYAAKSLVVAAGPWLPELVNESLARCFRVYRQLQFWFAPENESFRPDLFPVFIWELSGRKQAIYGFPDIGGAGVKIATEQYDEETTASRGDRIVHPRESALMHDSMVSPFLPGLRANCLRASACLYTVTPDFGFVIDRHPDCERVIIASCCSGHGFKHSAALGEAIAEMIVEGRSRLDLAPFGLGRLLAH
jgi:sarcosine oxidase